MDRLVPIAAAAVTVSVTILGGCPDTWEGGPPGVGQTGERGSGAEAPPPSEPETIDGGSTADGPVDSVFRGILEEGDRILSVDGTFYDAYTIDVSAGDAVVISMKSHELDPYVHVIDPEGTQLGHSDSVPAEDGRIAEITFVAPGAGTYQIYANALEAGMTGTYELRIVAQSLSPAPANTTDP